VDLKAGTIRLKSSETKTDKGRLIPLNQTLTSALKAATRYVRCPWVFVSQTMVDLWQADPEQVDPHYHAASTTHAIERACRTSGVSHATFHDLRHTFVTNARRAGIDYFRIMAITGHKMIAVFKRTTGSISRICRAHPSTRHLYGHHGCGSSGSCSAKH